MRHSKSRRKKYKYKLHVKERFMERFNYWLTDEMYFKMGNDILSGKASLYATKEDRDVIIYKMFIEEINNTILVYYNHIIARVVTVYPMPRR